MSSYFLRHDIEELSVSNTLLSIKDLKSRSIGVGGPLAALISGLSGYHKNFNYWILFPLWGLILSVIALLCPVLLPYLLLSYLSRRYKREHPNALDEICELELKRFNQNKASDAASSAAADATANAAATAPNADTAASASVASSAADSSAVKGSEAKANGETQAKQGKDGKEVEIDDVLLNTDHEISESTRKLDREAEASIVDEVDITEEEQHSFMKRYLATVDVAFNLKHNLLTVVGIMIVYYLGLFLMVEVSGHFIETATQAYMDAALKNKVLQIATPEQLAFNDRVVAIYAIAIGFMLLLHTFLSAVTCATLLGFNRAEKWKLAAGIVLKNLPGYAVLFALCYAVFTVIERYYAHFRLTAFESVVRGLEYTNLTVPFLLVRGYFIGAFLVAFILIILMSLGIISTGIKSKPKDSDPGPRMMRP